jgi:hypothetical protein
MDSSSRCASPLVHDGTCSIPRGVERDDVIRAVSAVREREDIQGLPQLSEEIGTPIKLCVELVVRHPSHRLVGVRVAAQLVHLRDLQDVRRDIIGVSR